MQLDCCPRCGGTDLDGPNPSRRPTGGRPKYQPVRIIVCTGCNHGFCVRVSKEVDPETRDRQAIILWNAARPAQMYPLEAR